MNNMDVTPGIHADKINEHLLIIHGVADNIPARLIM